MTVPVPDSNSIRVRPYRAGDESELVALFQRAFGQPSTDAHWRWKLRWPECPVDNVWVAQSEERSVFQYAGIPTRFSLNHRPATVMVSVDTMTAPEFRRRGLLTRVASQAYAQWREAGIAFVMGLPNEQWGSRADALGWQTLFPLQWMVRPLRPEAMLARRLRAPILDRARIPAALWNRFWQARVREDPSVHLERVCEADEAFDELWSTVEPGWALSTVRDRRWVEWRFLKSPTRTYSVTLARRRGRPVGYIAHALSGTEERPSAHLAELQTAPADTATRDTLMGALLRSLCASRVQAVSCLAIPGTPNFQWLRRCGFFPRQSFLIRAVPLREDLPWDLMRNPSHWNLSGADFDVI